MYSLFKNAELPVSNTYLLPLLLGTMAMGAFYLLFSPDSANNRPLFTPDEQKLALLTNQCRIYSRINRYEKIYDGADPQLQKTLSRLYQELLSRGRSSAPFKRPGQNLKFLLEMQADLLQKLIDENLEIRLQREAACRQRLVGMR